jgi:hypothetical protein
MADADWPAEAQAFLDQIKTWDGVGSGKMFGWAMLKAGGKAFVFWKGNIVAIRVSTENKTDALAIHGAKPFIPGDHVMKNWVAFSASLMSSAQLDLAQTAYGKLASG